MQSFILHDRGTGLISVGARTALRCEDLVLGNDDLDDPVLTICLQVHGRVLCPIHSPQRGLHHKWGTRAALSGRDFLQSRRAVRQSRQSAVRRHAVIASAEPLTVRFGYIVVV
jgi:hypothetical protein